MQLKAWETTIRAIVDQSNEEPKESGKQRVLTEWRVNLEKEPHLLRPYQIDEIVREVRRRLGVAGQSKAAP
jgi:hypothetical protein